MLLNFVDFRRAPVRAVLPGLLEGFRSRWTSWTSGGLPFVLNFLDFRCPVVLDFFDFRRAPVVFVLDFLDFQWAPVRAEVLERPEGSRSW